MNTEWNKLADSRPKGDGKHLVLKKGFTYLMGNTKDLEPDVAYYNGGRGCFVEDYNDDNFVYWMELPELPKEI